MRNKRGCNGLFIIDEPEGAYGLTGTDWVDPQGSETTNAGGIRQRTKTQ